MKYNRLFAVCLAVVMLASLLSGCALATKNTQRDNDRVLAVVNGQEIRKIEFSGLWEIYKNYYASQYGDLSSDDPAVQYTVRNLKQETFDNFVQSIIILQKAKELGFDALSEEDQNSAMETYESIIQSNYDSYAGRYAELLEIDPDFDAEAAGKQDFIDYLAQEGRTPESMQQDYLDNAAKTALQQSIQDSIEISDEEIQSYYDKLLLAQQLSYDFDSTAEENEEAKQARDAAVEAAGLSATPSFANDYDADGAMILYYPDTRAVLVTHILIEMEQEDKDKYNEAYSLYAGEELEQILEEAYTRIKPKAEEALAKVEAGEDFEELIKTYGADAGQLNYLERGGYVVTADSNQVEPFKAAALALKKVGDHTGLVQTTYGYHIIMLNEILPQKEVVPLGEFEEQIRTQLASEKSAALWEEKVAQWVEEAEIELYEDVLFS
ncbi:MAG: peptidylprolyl isomerase [Christensenellales bacterium]|jgi:parvulin-like peptidyl-prolyl isomerase